MAGREKQGGNQAAMEISWHLLDATFYVSIAFVFIEFPAHQQCVLNL